VRYGSASSGRRSGKAPAAYPLLGREKGESSIKLTCEIRIPVPPDDVAAVLLSSDEAPKWQKGLRAMEVVQGGPNQVGSLARLYYSESGREYVLQDELAECTPGRRWKSRVSGSGMTALVETELVELEEGTLVKLTWDGRPNAWWARIFFPLLRRRLERHITSDLAALDQLVRSRVS
jgi:uncharacterized protein YndB with AHSA1/START domain